MALRNRRSSNYLRRYTDLTALLNILSKKEITLLSPSTWEDRNDAHYLSMYKDKKNLKSVLALCFSQNTETYHHWRVFAPGPSGVCIEFRNPELIDWVKKYGVSAKEVEYVTLTDARRRVFKTAELPFIKRSAFRPESEFRLLYESEKEALPSINIPIDLSCIRRISLSPWLHKSLSPEIATLIRSIDGCQGMKISRSTLIANEEWQRFAS